MEICREISFSIILEMVESRLMGRYDVTSVGSFPGLSAMILWADLKSAGQ